MTETTETTTPEIPAYAMPEDFAKKTLITEVIRYEIVREIFDPATGAVLDIRTCAALINGDNVVAVRDPKFLREFLADPDNRAALLKHCPDLRVFYQN